MRRIIRRHWLLALLFAMVLGAASGYQILGTSRDYENYLAFFDFARSFHSYWSMEYRFEPGFSILVYWLAKIGFGDAAIYTFIAACIIFIKYISIERTDRYVAAISIFTFYFLTRYIALFEMTVLRAACAFSIAFFVFFRKKTPDLTISDTLILLMAVMFHYSAIVFLFVYFIRPINRWRVIAVAIVVFAFILSIEKIVLRYLPEYLTILSSYKKIQMATILPIPFAIDIGFLFFALKNFSYADWAMRYAIFGMTLAVSFHFSLLEHSVIASRFRELLSVFNLIYVVRANYCKDIRVRRVSILYTLLTGFLHWYVLFVHDPLLS